MLATNLPRNWVFLSLRPPITWSRCRWDRPNGYVSMALLFGKEVMADSIFRETEDRYLELKELAKTVTNRPTVISEKKFGSSWYMPAGDSYVAHLYNDAGADYIFKDLPGAGSTPLAFETVLDKAIHANMWLIKYNQTNDMTYKDLRTEYTPYENFDAFKNRRIYTCNTGIVPYYEEFPIHPDYLLKDLCMGIPSGVIAGLYAPVLSEDGVILPIIKTKLWTN